MKKYMLYKKIEAEKYIIYLIMMLIIMQGNSVYVYITNSNQFLIIGVMILLLFLCYLQRKILITENLKVFLLLFSVSMGSLSLYNYETPSLLFLTICFCLFLLFENKKNLIFKMLYAFSDIAFIIAIISFILFVTINVLGLVNMNKAYSNLIIPWGTNNYQSFFDIYFTISNWTTQSNIFNFRGSPNTGVFTEGPMFAYTLVIALYIELMFKRRINYTRIIIISLTCLTTFSDNALIGLFLCILFYYYSKVSNKNIRKIYILLGIIIATIFILTVLNLKFSAKNMSFSIRLDDIFASLRAFMNNPIIGVGFNNPRALDQYREFYSNRLGGNSTGFLAILAYGGIIWGIWYVIPFVYSLINIFKRQIKQKVATNGFIIITFILLINISIHDRLISFWICSISWAFIFQKFFFKEDLCA